MSSDQYYSTDSSEYEIDDDEAPQEGCAAKPEEIEQPVEEEKSKKQQNLIITTDEKPDEIVELCVRNLSFAATEDMLTENFSICGDIKSVRIPVNKSNGHSKGFAIVVTNKATADHIITQFNNVDFQGRPLIVEYAKAKTNQQKPYKNDSKTVSRNHNPKKPIHYPKSNHKHTEAKPPLEMPKAEEVPQDNAGKEIFKFFKKGEKGSFAGFRENRHSSDSRRRSPFRK